MTKKDKVLMTSDKTWIRKEEWNFQKEHLNKLHKEFLQEWMFGITSGGLNITNPVKPYKDGK